MNIWPRSQLAEISDSVEYGLTASADASLVGPKFLRITDIQDGNVDWETVPGCPCSDADVQKYGLQTGDIVFARTGATTGKSFLLENPPPNAVFASYLIRVRPNKKNVNPRFLAHFFNTPDYWRQIRKDTTGTTQPGVNGTKLKDIHVPLPPLPEQKRIAAILDKADAIRRKRQQAIRLTEELLRSAFLDMFGDPVTNPKGWEIKKLREHIASIEAGWSANGEPRLPEGDEDAVLKISAVTSGTFRPDECKAVPAHSRDVPRPRRGDLLMSRANTRELVAATCLVEDDSHQRFLPDKLWRVNFKGSLHAEYFRYLLWDPTIRSNLTRSATGTSGSMLNVSKDKLMEYAVPSPPPELQAKFREVVWRAYDSRRWLRAANNVANQLTEALTQAAFSGNL